MSIIKFKAYIMVECCHCVTTVECPSEIYLESAIDLDSLPTTLTVASMKHDTPEGWTRATQPYFFEDKYYCPSCTISVKNVEDLKEKRRERNKLSIDAKNKTRKKR